MSDEELVELRDWVIKRLCESDWTNPNDRGCCEGLLLDTAWKLHESREGEMEMNWFFEDEENSRDYMLCVEKVE